MTYPQRVGLFLIVSVLALGGFFVAPPFRQPFPQPLAYHNFADRRCLLSLPHCLNVVSNLPFLIVGVWGLAWMARDARWSAASADGSTHFLLAAERWPFWVFFAGTALTGIGSAYYHADPTNERLVWDRLPLAVAFMALFTSVLTERIDVRLTQMLIPLTIVGGGSVLYWGWTESQGHGDLRPYLLVQFFPLLALPLLLMLFSPRYTGTADLVGSLACYVVAKALELADVPIYNQGQLVSGHTLKHLMAGVSAYFILLMLQRRRRFAQGSVPGVCTGG